MNEIVVVVVTYNRKELLDESINALLNQSYKNFDLLIVDNNSNDGTYEDVIKKYENNTQLKYINTKKNLGGAGGFNFGLKKAIENHYKFAWLMDDDSIPEVTSLESIVNNSEKLKNNFSYISSYVKWIDGSFCKMNSVSFDDSKILESYNLSTQNLLAIKTASFVGCYINLAYVYDVGYPISDFFIYADDLEYTDRLSQKNTAYIDLNSIIVHKMKDNVPSEIQTVAEDRISRYFYDYRNITYFLINRKHFRGFVLSLIRYWMGVKRIIKFAKTKKMKRLKVITKGFLSGIFFHPKKEYVDYNKKEN